MQKLNIKYGILFTTLLFTTLGVFISCDNEETLKYVDLRYKVDEPYLVDATNAQKIEIQVKSSDPWEVFGSQNWHSITPDHGDPGETTTVSILCEDNTDLDDRIDTITIKSDFRIGKRFVITQKGTAFLNLENTENFVLPLESSERTFNIISNQDWSAKVTEGEEWISITKGNTGKLNGEVTVHCTKNTGEKRSGQITVYDRHEVECGTVDVTQEGVVLLPAKELFKVFYQKQMLKIPVESNGEWTVKKDNEDDVWFQLENTSFDGNGEISITFNENPGGETRSSLIVLETKATEGIQPVTKVITLKQGYKPRTTRYEFTDSELGLWSVEGGRPGKVVFDGDAHLGPGAARLVRSGFRPGLYTFNIMETSEDSNPSLWFVTDDGHEIRYHIGGGSTQISSNPWGPGIDNKPYDMKKPHIIALDMNLDETSGKYFYCTWYLDGEAICSSTIETLYNTSFTVYFGNMAGSAKYDWYEYTPPVDWGE